MELWVKLSADQTPALAVSRGCRGDATHRLLPPHNGVMSADEFRDQVASLSRLDEDELLVMLADAVVLGVGPLDPDRKRSLGRAWMDAQLDRLREVVCGEAGAALRDVALSDEIEAAAGVADLVAAVTGKLPAATVAMLLVRSGLGNLCA